MKKLHVEFDAVVSDRTAKEFKEWPYEVVLLDNLHDALELESDEETENLKITEKPNEDIH